MSSHGAEPGREALHSERCYASDGEFWDRRCASDNTRDWFFAGRIVAVLFGLIEEAGYHLCRI